METSEGVHSELDYSDSATVARKVNVGGYFSNVVGIQDDRFGMYRRAKERGQDVWLSEMGYYYEFYRPNRFINVGRYIIEDLRHLLPSAYLWNQAVDDESATSSGLIQISYDNPQLSAINYTTEFWVMKQFSKYIIPGSAFFFSSDHGTVAAYKDKTLVIVLVNDDARSDPVANKTYDLGLFDLSAGTVVLATRSSTTENNVFLDPAPTISANGNLVYAAPYHSVTTFVISGIFPKAATSSLLVNTEFEEAGNSTGTPLGWEVEGGAARVGSTWAFRGSFAVRLDPTGSSGRISQNLTIPDDAPAITIFYLSFRAFATTRQASVGVIMNESMETKVDLVPPGSVVLGSDYRSYGLTFQAGARDRLHVYFYSPRDDRYTVWLDDFNLHA